MHKIYKHAKVIFSANTNYNEHYCIHAKTVVKINSKKSFLSIRWTFRKEFRAHF